MKGMHLVKWSEKKKGNKHEDIMLKSSLLNSKSKREKSEKMMSTKVPKGYFAIYVGDEMERFVIPVKYLRCPMFQFLMQRAEEEFGYQPMGALRIPCDEDDFREILDLLEADCKLHGLQ